MKTRRIVVPKKLDVYQVGHKLPSELAVEHYFVYTLTQRDFEMLWNENIIKLMNHVDDAILHIDDFKDTVIDEVHLIEKMGQDLKVLEGVVNEDLKLVLQKIEFLLNQALERKTPIIFNF